MYTYFIFKATGYFIFKAMWKGQNCSILLHDAFKKKYAGGWLAGQGHSPGQCYSHPPGVPGCTTRSTPVYIGCFHLPIAVVLVLPLALVLALVGCY